MNDGPPGSAPNVPSSRPKTNQLAGASHATRPTLDTREILASINAGLRREAPELPLGRELVRVTERPFDVVDPGVGKCAPASRALVHDPHAGYSIDVYVTEAGYGTMSSGKGVYPPGTIILKQKFRGAAARGVDFFTGMWKREKGYNAECGDWEFFVADAAAKVKSSGKLRSCIDCHAPFTSTDFVSRAYLKESSVAHR